MPLTRSRVSKLTVETIGIKPLPFRASDTPESQRWESNPQPPHYECGALPIEATLATGATTTTVWQRAETPPFKTPKDSAAHPRPSRVRGSQRAKLPCSTGKKTAVECNQTGFNARCGNKKSGAFDSAGASCHESAGQGQVTALPKKSLRPHPCERVEGQTEEKSESKRNSFAGTGFPADCIARAANVPKSIGCNESFMQFFF